MNSNWDTFFDILILLQASYKSSRVYMIACHLKKAILSTCQVRALIAINCIGWFMNADAG